MSERIIDKRKHKFVLVDNPILLDAELSDAAFRLYCVLLKYAGSDNGCWPGLTRLAQDMNKGKSTISRLFDELVNRGLVSRQRRFKRSSITWIEDVTAIYTESLKNEIYLKNEIIAKMRDQEALKNESTESYSELNINDTPVVNLLSEFGIDSLIARKLEAQGVTLELAKAWTDYTKSHRLDNPQGFVVSRLKLGEFPPVETKRNDFDPQSYISGPFSDVVQH